MLRVSLRFVVHRRYYFGADGGGYGALVFATPLSGLPYFSRTSDGYERLSAYVRTVLR